ncbi:MAG: hypothetical protein PHX21_12620 [bacterium]|nr:hypothetical protein [bacterium]
MKTFAERIQEKNARNIKLSTKERIYDFLVGQDDPVTFSAIQAIFQPNEKGYAGQDKRRRELNKDLFAEGKMIECKRHSDNTFKYQIVKLPESKTKITTPTETIPQPTIPKKPTESQNKTKEYVGPMGDKYPWKTAVQLRVF